MIIVWSQAMEAASLHLRTCDPVLAKIIKRVGPCQLANREPTQARRAFGARCARSHFETLARSITFQQLHGKAAATIFARVQKAVGRRFTAAAFLKLTPEQLRACGLSRQKIASLTDLAKHVASRRINFRKLHALEDAEVIALLSEVRGVGVWTAQMFLIFALRRPNVMPLEDLGIRSAVRKAYGLAEMPKSAELAKIAEKWHPHCSVASWYLWRSLDGPADL
jgi:DNA-3-methyladenine glycosylase II